ncbi:metal-dependent phosphohydrolase, partial [Streptomyces sp. ETH9427]
MAPRGDRRRAAADGRARSCRTRHRPSRGAPVRPRAHTVPLHTVVHLCAAVLAAGSLGTTLYHGVEDRSVALAFGTLV